MGNIALRAKHNLITNTKQA